ncbi:Receptor-like protein, partial [Thalictrum thalictroides]
NCGLFGTFPEKIFQLPLLRSLDIYGNSLVQGSMQPEFPENGSLEVLWNNSTLHSCMSNLTQLLYLDISSNNFTGPVPHFSSSENLTFIELADNRLTGPISSLQWDRHLKLERVSLRNNSLNGTIPVGGMEGIIPSSIFRLPSLIYLSLASNNFSGTVRLSMFQKFKNLSNLDLSGNKLSINSGGINSSLFPQVSLLSLASCKLTEFPEFFKNQLKLDYLDLSNNQIRGKIPNWIWQIGNGYLAHLNLSLNFLENPDQPLPSFHFKWLVTLDFHSNLLQGSIPILPPVASVLDYSNNNLTSIIPVDIGSYLQYAIFFSLSHNFLRGEIPMSVCEATSLRVLDLSSNSLRGSIPRWSLPAQLFLTWKGMMTNEDDTLDKYNQQILRYEFQRLGRLYYQDVVTVANKGMQMELLKILTIFTSIDMSNN